jgi:hypothetical protein
MVDRAALYVDGFNLYHAIDDLQLDYLKWLNLWKLGELLIPSMSETLAKVVYCTAICSDDPKRWSVTAAMRRPPLGVKTTAALITAIGFVVSPRRRCPASRQWISRDIGSAMWCENGSQMRMLNVTLG